MVEDNDALARELAALQKEHGYDAEAVAIGHDAVAYHVAGAYVAIILDLGLPDISGFEILNQLRGARTSCPIPVLTARSALDDRVRCLDLGADDYLPKPFEPPELLARVRALLRRSQGDPSPRVKVGALSWDRTSGAFFLDGESFLLTSPVVVYEGSSDPDLSRL